jgi:hypothetical protein
VAPTPRSRKVSPFSLKGSRQELENASVTAIGRSSAKGPAPSMGKPLV